MALFSQDDDSEDETPDMGSAFSGGQDPQESDAVTESPVPEAVDQADSPAPVSPDDANTYAQSPDEEHGDDEGREASLAPGDDSDGAIYAQPAAGAPAAQDSGTGGGAQLPSMPQYVDNLPNYQALEKEISNFKPSDYKPSIGRKILAGLAGGAVTFGSRNPQAGAATVQRVEGKPLAVAQAQEQQQEQATRQQIADVNAQNQTRQTQYQNQRTAANDAALNEYRNEHGQNFKEQAYQKSLKLVPVDPNNPFGEWQQVDPSGKVVARGQEPPAGIKNDPRYQEQLRITKIGQASDEADRIGLKGEQKQRYVAEIMGSKNTFPTERQSINIREGIGAPAGQDPESLIQQHLQDKQSFADGWQRVDAAHAGPGVPEGSYVPADTDLNDVKTGDFKPGKTNFLSGQQFNDKIDKFRTDLNAKPEMQKAGIGLDQNGNVTRGGRPTVPASAEPTPATAAPKTFDRTQIPKNVPLPAGSVWVQAPNGTIGHIPQANLQKAISRGYAVPGA